MTEKMPPPKIGKPIKLPCGHNVLFYQRPHESQEAKDKRRAALMMLLALVPSRETPQTTRSCSSGIQRP